MDLALALDLAPGLAAFRAADLRKGFGSGMVRSTPGNCVDLATLLIAP